MSYVYLHCDCSVNYFKNKEIFYTAGTVREPTTLFYKTGSQVPYRNYQCIKIFRYLQNNKVPIHQKGPN
jgi:hypothetical protein